MTLTFVHVHAQSLLIPPVFSVTPGFYEQEVQLSIVHPDTTLQIWFTTNGTEPVVAGQPTPSAIQYTRDSVLSLSQFIPDSTAISFIPTTPEEANTRGFGWIKPEELLPGAHTIRAVAMNSSGESTIANSGTWFVGITVPDLPVISIVTPPDGLFGQEEGIYVPGLIYDENGYGNNFWGVPHANYHERGEEWERVGHFEYFVNGERKLGQNTGLRIHGGGSRTLPMKSLRIYARNEYGNSTLDYPFFGDGNDSSFKRLILRNSGQDFYYNTTMFRDGAIQQIAGELDIITQDFQPSIVYLNGEFWGIHNIRERYDHHFIERVTGISREDLDYLTAGGTADEGDDVAYNEIIQILRHQDITHPSVYADIADRIDIANFIDYQILNIHFKNDDWPGNNIDYFRYRGEPVDGHPFKDGRFRWLLYDTDAGFTNAHYDMLVHSTEAGNTSWPNPDWSTFMLRKLLEADEFRALFIYRYLELLNTTFQPSHILKVLDERHDAIASVMPMHIQRWGYPHSISSWDWAVGIHRSFAEQRSGFVRNHLEDFFDISLSSVHVDINKEAVAHFAVNGRAMEVDEAGWSGFFFADSLLTLQIFSAPGYRFEGWLVNNDSLITSTVLQIHPHEDVTIEALFETHTPNTDSELIHFWFFDDNLPNNTPLSSLSSTYSVIHTASINYYPALSTAGQNGDVAGILDRVNAPTLVNFPSHLTEIESDSGNMRGIRVRNPSKVADSDTIRHSSLIFNAPTSGYERVQLSFAANRTSNGQELLHLWYSADSSDEWIPYYAESEGIPIPQGEFGLFLFDFKDIPEANDNDALRLKITFEGSTVTGFEGNARFNNIIIIGYAMSVSVDNPEIPETIAIHGNYPNPFNPTTTIRFSLPEAAHTKLQVYNTLGQHVATLTDGLLAQGSHEVIFDAGMLGSGVYIYRFEVNGYMKSGKMLLIR